MGKLWTPKEELDLLAMYMYEHKNYTEIAKELGRSYSSVKSKGFSMAHERIFLNKYKYNLDKFKDKRLYCYYCYIIHNLSLDDHLSLAINRDKFEQLLNSINLTYYKFYNNIVEPLYSTVLIQKDNINSRDDLEIVPIQNIINKGKDSLIIPLDIICNSIRNTIYTYSSCKLDTPKSRLDINAALFKYINIYLKNMYNVFGDTYRGYNIDLQIGWVGSQDRTSIFLYFKKDNTKAFMLSLAGETILKTNLV